MASFLRAIFFVQTICVTLTMCFPQTGAFGRINAAAKGVVTGTLYDLSQQLPTIDGKNAEQLAFENRLFVRLRQGDDVFYGEQPVSLERFRSTENEVYSFEFVFSAINAQTGGPLPASDEHKSRIWSAILECSMGTLFQWRDSQFPTEARDSDHNMALRMWSEAGNNIDRFPTKCPEQNRPVLEIGVLNETTGRIDILKSITPFYYTMNFNENVEAGVHVAHILLPFNINTGNDDAL